jgi:hypothetical protein
MTGTQTTTTTVKDAAGTVLNTMTTTLSTNIVWF